MTREQMAELIGGIEDAPVPANMARRAVDRWALEATRPSVFDRLAGWMAGPAVRPAIALAAAAVLVVVVRGRMGEEPRVHETRSAPVAPEPVRAKVAERSVMGDTSARREPRPPRPNSVKPLAPSKGIQRTRAALTAPAPAVGLAEKVAPPRPEPPSPKLAARADMESLASSGSDSTMDLAYLNGADANEGVREDEGRWSDARLLVRITLAEDDTALPDLMGRIGDSAGLAVAFSDALADTKVAVHCVDRPVGEVMRQMARAFDLRWERSGAGSSARYAAVPTRRLVADVSADMGRAAAAPGGMGGSAGPSPSKKTGGSAGASPSQDGPWRAAGRAAPPERHRAEANEKMERPRTNWIGNPARVRAMRADGSMPAGAIVEGWIIAR